jgi:NAD(P)-dependent dehydrogenase (short-subunit alcohol dehydrogenase family)
MQHEFQLPELNIDILINNAGVNISKALSLQVSERLWQQTLDVNLYAPFKLVQKYLPYMVSVGWGRIINISSIYGLRASSQNLPYNVSKHGLAALTKTIAKEYGGVGITSNEICPGPVDSYLMERISVDQVKETGVPAEQYLQNIRQLIPTQRFALPEEVAYLTLFLASTYAAYINGTSIPLDGGLLA